MTDIQLANLRDSRDLCYIVIVQAMAGMHRQTRCYALTNRLHDTGKLFSLLQLVDCICKMSGMNFNAGRTGFSGGQRGTGALIKGYFKDYFGNDD